MELFNSIFKNNEIEEVKPYKRTNTTRFFDQFNTVMYLVGFNNYWIEEVQLPRKFTKIFKYVDIVICGGCFVLCTLMVGALFVEMELTTKQMDDRNTLLFLLPVTFAYRFKLLICKKEIRQLYYHLAVVLKEHHNDPDIESRMIKQMKTYMISFFICLLIASAFFGVYSLLESIRTGGPFVTVVTMWPDIKDRSAVAEVARIVIYISWCIITQRLLATYLLVIAMLLGISHQYMNLQSYFYGIQNIFDNKTLSQREKEENYEEAFKIGIKMHVETIWSVNQCQTIFKEIFASVVVMSLGVLINFIPSMVNFHENAEVAIAEFPALLCMLLIIGIFMWSGGDINVEAAKLPNAMYSSGWENCYGRSSVRVRKLVVIAMEQAQQPVMLPALGVVELSYETYVSIIKSAYSVFSVFY